MPRITQAGINLVISAVNGVADGIRNNSERMTAAGINLATAMVEGVIRGIHSSIQRAVNSAVKLAQDMFNAAKAALGISSPSKEFIWLMRMAIDGIVVGGDKYGYLAEDAGAQIGENMIDSMSKTLTGLGKVLGSDLVDFDPTITPVLDLSLIKKSAGEIDKLLGSQSLNVSGSYGEARAAKSSYDRSRSDNPDDPSNDGGTTYSFTQNNYSPKALSSAEVYRQTNNLISKTKAVK